MVPARPLETSRLTWTALLGSWMDAAKAARATTAPPDWADAVTHVITLQAIEAALGELARLEEADRPFARDRAAVMIEQAAGALDEHFRGRPMPEELLTLMEDVTAALERAPYAGCVELVWPGPGALVMPDVPTEGSDGTLAVMQPGTIAQAGQPLAWWVATNGDAIVRAVPGAELREVDLPRQVYRVIDADGMITGDEERTVLDEPVAGMPLLVPLRAGGEAIGHFTMDAATWLGKQQAAGMQLPGAPPR